MKNFRNDKRGGMFGIAIIIIAAIIISAIVGVFYWGATHYSIEVGECGIVTDQWGGFIRAELGPKGYAEKGIFEKVSYYTVKVQTEEMCSPVEKKTVNIDGKEIQILSVNPIPYQDQYTSCVYPALTVNTKDATAYIDIGLQYHLNTIDGDWKDGMRVLYTNFPEESLAQEAIYNMVRDYARKYAQDFTVNELCYTNTLAYSDGVTSYVQQKLNAYPALGKTVILDKIFVRQVTAPEGVQIQYNKVLEAEKAADTTMINANTTRDAAITIAQGQATAISLVVNASKSAIMEMQASNMTQQQIIDYLTVQYQFDALKAIYQANPNAAITIFINTPNGIQYNIPLKQEP